MTKRFACSRSSALRRRNDPTGIVSRLPLPKQGEPAFFGARFYGGTGFASQKKFVPKHGLFFDKKITKYDPFIYCFFLRVYYP
jgi:hypothetical protein